MPTHKVRLLFRAVDDGSRSKPFRVIAEAQYGRISMLKRLRKNGTVYSIEMFTEDDPSEILHELRTSGVFVLQMDIDGVCDFTHPNRDEILKERTATKAGRK